MEWLSMRVTPKHYKISMPKSEQQSPLPAASSYRFWALVNPKDERLRNKLFIW
jgi:hypothetical protein